MADPLEEQKMRREDRLYLISASDHHLTRPGSGSGSHPCGAPLRHNARHITFGGSSWGGQLSFDASLPGTECAPPSSPANRTQRFSVGGPATGVT
jgi:hypothetical protein